MSSIHAVINPTLSFTKLDIEKRLCMPAGRFTSAGPLFPLLCAVLLSVGFYAALIPLQETWFAQSFTQRGWVPYSIVFFSLWTMMIMLVKRHKIGVQQRALSLRVVPEDADFVMTAAAAGRTLERLHDLADDPKNFLLFNRIQIALSNLRNIGRVSDVDEVLRGQAENDESMMESSYTVARGLIWAIPVLGFIGTVLGLSQAIGSFTGVLAQSSDIDTLKPALQSVTAGLSTAFETTLQALVAAVVIYMLMTAVKRTEEQMLDNMTEYCQRSIVARLKLPVETPVKEAVYGTKIPA